MWCPWYVLLLPHWSFQYARHPDYYISIKKQFASLTSSFAWNFLRLIVRMQFISALLPMPQAETTRHQTHGNNFMFRLANVLKVFVFFPVHRNCHYIARGTCDLKTAALRLKREIKTHHHNSTSTIKTFWNSSDFGAVAHQGVARSFWTVTRSERAPYNQLIDCFSCSRLTAWFISSPFRPPSLWLRRFFIFSPPLNQHIEYAVLWIYFRTARNKKFLLRNKCEGQSPPEGITMMG